MVLSRARAPRAVVAAAAVAVLLGGCALLERIPADPDGTLETIGGGVLEAGASLSDPHVVLGDDGSLRGDEVALVESFADEMDAEVDWTVGGEEALVGALEAGELDLVVGGITDATPWADRAAVTRPHDEVVRPDGSTDRFVVLLPMGENALLAALERHIDGGLP